jgi:hypothetical protein
MSALYEAAYGLYVPFGENTRCDLMSSARAKIARIQIKTGRLRRGAVEFNVCSSYAHHANPKVVKRTYENDVDFRCVLPRNRTGVSHPRRSTAEAHGDAVRRAVEEQSEARRPTGGPLRDRASRYRRTSRAFWCVMIFRFTRCRALSIVFVSQPSSAAMSS